MDAASGAVSVGSGGAQFIPYTATRTALTTITINCSGGKKCHLNDVTITITRGSATGRLGQINGMAVDFTGGATATYVSGTTSCTSCSSMTFVINQVAASGTSGSKTFHLGLTVPVNTTGTLGNATSAYSIQASGTGYTTGSGSAAIQSTVEGKLGIQWVNDLKFGTLVLIAGQSGTLTWDAANQTYSSSPASGLVVQRGTTSIATFTVTGTPAQAVNFSLSGNAGLPNKIRLTNGQGNTLDITPSTTGLSAQTLPTPTGVLTFYVGGTISVSPTMNTGAYSGSFTITANYN